MKRNLLRKEEDADPISVVSNLFDVAMVFAVALMVALVSRYNMTEVFSQEDYTMVKNPEREYGNHHQRRTEDQPLYSFGRPAEKRQEGKEGRYCL